MNKTKLKRDLNSVINSDKLLAVFRSRWSDNALHVSLTGNEDWFKIVKKTRSDRARNKIWSKQAGLLKRRLKKQFSNIKSITNKELLTGHAEYYDGILIKF
jgi:hypothetical protein